MSDPFRDYLHQRLGELLSKHRVVVFYDPREEFLPFVERELEDAAIGEHELPRLEIGGESAHVARFDGSFFRLRAAAEPIFAAREPEPLLLYLPGIERDRETSLLMELEQAGTCYEPQLKRLARNVLRQHFNDAQIDDLLRSGELTWDDVTAFLRQGDEGRAASLLRGLFPNLRDEELLGRWLADGELDATIAAKKATAELLERVEKHLGLALDAETPLAEAREKTLRHVLVGEFRSDLGCEPPTSLGMIPTPPSEDHVARVRSLAAHLRATWGDTYVELADRVERGLGLAAEDLDPADLGAIDTFRFEEKRLLGHALEQIVEGAHETALAIVEKRHRSFWVDRDVARQAQWQVCRLMAELGLGVEKARAGVATTGDDPAAWVDAYTAEGGWHELDRLQRTLESWVWKMEEEPEGERALRLVRNAHGELLQRMAEGFVKALQAKAWIVDGPLHQTRVYAEIVEPALRSGEPVAYFLVDALRFEMGAELYRQLEGAEERELRPAIAALPTITSVGMAALLPGAVDGFSVVERGGELAASVEGSTMPSWAERWKFLHKKIPDMFETRLGSLFGMRSEELEHKVREAALVIVRSQDVDLAGETDRQLLARQTMDSIVANLARAVRKLARAGVERFVVVADHGHQFAGRKDEDMRTDAPGGQTVEIHRRCWAGHGGTTPPGTVRVTGAELGYASDLEFIFPTGLGVFKTAGGLDYHHGGASLQELVIPVLSLAMATRRGASGGIAKVSFPSLPSRIDNRTFSVRLRVEPDLFTPEIVPLRLGLFVGAQQVAEARVVIDAEHDRDTGLIHARVGVDAMAGFLLTGTQAGSVRVVALDPESDAVLGESPEIPIELAIPES